MADPVAGEVMTHMTGPDYHSLNPFKSPNCTWYAWGRAKEKCNFTIEFSRDSNRPADLWFSLVTNCTKHGKLWSPTANVIACFSQGTGCVNGHVIFIEAVRGSNIFFTEGNAGSPGVLKEKSLPAFKTLYGHVLQGYLVV